MPRFQRRHLFLTIGCFIIDLFLIGLQSQPIVFPTLINYQALLWFSSMRLLQGISALSLIVIAHLYGCLAYRELFFVSGAAVSALLLKQVLQESKLVVFAFTGLFYLVHASLMELSIAWTSFAFCANIILMYSILSYQDVR